MPEEILFLLMKDLPCEKETSRSLKGLPTAENETKTHAKDAKNLHLKNKKKELIEIKI